MSIKKKQQNLDLPSQVLKSEVEQKDKGKYTGDFRV